MCVKRERRKDKEREKGKEREKKKEKEKKKKRRRGEGKAVKGNGFMAWKARHGCMSADLVDARLCLPNLEDE